MEPQVILSQLVLPLALAMMMLVMGMSVRPLHFRRLLQQPGMIVLGLVLQWLVLPLLALLLVMLLPLPQTVVIGLVILAACPGGATSNIISHLSGGDAALSVTLTTVVSLLSPLTLPLAVNLMLSALGLGPLEIQLSFATALVPLLLVTVVPLLLGMALRHFLPGWSQRYTGLLNRASFGVFVVLVVALAWVNSERLPQLGSLVTLACLGLCVLVMMAAALISRLFSNDMVTIKTLMIEAGIQNAGTAMLVAVTLLQRPDLALVALFYGILMNLPALLMIVRQQFGHSVYTEA